MYREIEIGEKKIPMLANGATPVRYKLIFGKDLITEFQGAEQNAAAAMDALPELAFIMAKAAEAQDKKVDMNKLNREMYLEWLEQFGPMDLPLASEQILAIYTGNQIMTSEPKKKEKAK